MITKDGRSEKGPNNRKIYLYDYVAEEMGG